MKSLIDAIRESKQGCKQDEVKLSSKELTDIHTEVVKLRAMLGKDKTLDKRHLLVVSKDAIAEDIVSNIFKIIDILEERHNKHIIVSPRDIYILYNLCAILYSICSECKVEDQSYLEISTETPYEVVGRLVNLFQIKHLLNIIEIMKKDPTVLNKLVSISEQIEAIIKFINGEYVGSLIDVVKCPAKRLIMSSSIVEKKITYNKKDLDKILIDLYSDILTGVLTIQRLLEGTGYIGYIDLYLRYLEYRLEKIS